MRNNSQNAATMQQKHNQKHRKQSANELNQSFVVSTVADVGRLLESAAEGDTRAVSEAIALLQQLNDYFISNNETDLVVYLGNGIKGGFIWTAELLHSGGKTLAADLRGAYELNGGISPSEKAFYRQLSECYVRFAAQFYNEVTPNTILGCSDGMRAISHKEFAEAVARMSETISVWLTGTPL